MFLKNKQFYLFLLSLWLYHSPSYAIEITPAVDNFIQRMVEQHHFDATKLTLLLKSAKLKTSILKAMARPIEGGHTPWYQYRKIFLTEQRIQAGVNFWLENQAVIAEVVAKYHVPPQIIVAILGAETAYGQDMGRFRLLDSLSTLGFEYPRRSEFFLTELENFLLLCDEEKLNPREITGSYTGAMGFAQFMPSSFRTYAVDFDQDKRRDLWSNVADIVASVANYLVKYGWTEGGVAYPVTVSGDEFQPALTDGLALDTTLAELGKLKITFPKDLETNTPVKLFAFEQEQTTDYWVGLNNFYVITRYNHSSLYAMAVYQLSEAILAAKEAHP